MLTKDILSEHASDELNRPDLLEEVRFHQATKGASEEEIHFL